MLKSVLYAALFYALCVVGVFIFQRNLIYAPQTGNNDPQHWQLPRVQLVHLTTADGKTLTAWFAPPSQPQTPTVIYFHGNHGPLSHRANIIRPYLNAGFGVLALAYRGYSGSTGSPSEQGLYEDGRAALRFVHEQGILSACTVLYGTSLGSGVAVKMATEFPVGALVLQSAYSRLADVGQYQYPYLPVKALLRDRFDSISRIHQVSAPILMLHGDKDRTIPLKLAQQLFAAAPDNPKKMHIYAGAGHNDLPDSSRLIRRFLSRHRVCHSAPSVVS